MPVRLALLVATLCGAISSRTPGAEQYARPELLLEPSALAKPDVASRFVVLDARKKETYEQDHIPGARWVDHEAWRLSLADGTDAEGWGKRIGDLGIGADSSVAVYGDATTPEAARIWWLLRYWGVRDVRLLHGGWKAWRTASFPTEANQPPPAQQLAFPAAARKQLLATKQQIADSLADKTLQIVDARSHDEFCGIDLKGNKRGGAIPGAKHLDWIALTDPTTGRFKSPEELRLLFARAGIDLDKPTASYCQTGGRASVMAFALELMGAKDSWNYYASWSEWGNDESLPLTVAEKQ